MSFGLACGLELGGLGIAFVGGAWLGVDVTGGFQGSPANLGWGLVAALPMLAVLACVLGARGGALGDVRRFLLDVAAPGFRPWPIWQLGVLSVVAGLAEEALFRGVLQTWLSGVTGPVPALMITSLVFGALHCVTPAYAMLAAGFGVVLGSLCLPGQGWFGAMVAHAVYDFIALVWLTRMAPPSGP